LDPAVHVKQQLIMSPAVGISPVLADTTQGMTVGSRLVMGSRTACLVFVGSIIDWLWTAQAFGFEPKLIHFCHDTPLVGLVWQLFPDAKVVVGSRGTLPSFNLPRVAFLHGSSGSFDFLFDQVDVLVMTKGKWGKVPVGWRLTKTQVAHSCVGGATDGLDRCYLWVRRDHTLNAEEIPVPMALPRDVHSVISNMVGGVACAKPSGACMKTPQVLET
jgi:hypothetical protein